MNPPTDKAPQFKTWVDVLQYQALNKPAKPAYTFIEGYEERGTLTFSQLDRRARAVAATLQSGATIGDRALLLYPPGLEYISAFLGCIYAGVIPVPACPPQSSQMKRHLPRLQSIFADAQPHLILTASCQLAKAKLVFSGIAGAGSIHWLATDTITDDGNDWVKPALTPDSLVFLQYTSGSTAFPKGVMIMHRNLLHNESIIKKAFEHSEDSLIVGWLPHYHDMGLVGNVLQPLYSGAHCILMSPASFLQDPLQWLSAISRYKATTSGGPNFAYELCVQKTRSEDRSALDLSSWRVAFNGAERVRHETIERFTRAFEVSGFRREAFYPCYGLAEATLIVAGGKVSCPPISRTFSSVSLERDKVANLTAVAERVCTLTGCGRSLYEQGILIVDPESLVECEPGKIGEIWVSGESVAKGYWQKPEQTETVFRAHTNGRRRGPYLRTGDMGFVFEGELFISGRLKDLILTGGHNHYPEDIELTVERSHEALRPGCSVAFSVDVEEEEKLVVVQEVARGRRNANWEEAVFAIRQAVAEQHGLQVHAVVLVRPGSIPKTSSGKVQRHVCRSRFLGKQLDVLQGETIGESPVEFNGDPLTRETIMAGDTGSRQSRLESYLIQAAARVLKVQSKRLDPKRSLSSLGIDSLMAIQLASLIEIHLQVAVPMARFLEAANFTELASLVLSQMVNDAPANKTTEDQEGEQELLQGRPAALPILHVPKTEVSADFSPVTWYQESLWLQHHQSKGSGGPSLNILLAIRLNGHLRIDALEQSLNVMVSRHAILRTTYRLVNESLVQIISPPTPVSLPVVTLPLMPEAARKEEVCRCATQEAQHLFDLRTESLIKPSLLQVTPEENVLFIVTHHIACDGWSVQLFLEELWKFYQKFSTDGISGQVLPELPPQYSTFAQRQPAGFMPEVWKAELDYWKRHLAGNLPELILPQDRVQDSTSGFDSAHETVSICEPLATALKTLSKNEDVTLFMLLLSAFKILLCRISQQTDIIVGSSMANRNSAEVLKMIGPFTNAVALRTSLHGDPDFRQILNRVKTVTLQAYANQEVPFDAVLRQIGRKAGDRPLFNTVFLLQNFLASGWNMNGLTAELEDFTTGLGNFDLALLIYEKAGTLAGTLKYNAGLYDPDTIRNLAASYVAILEQIVKNPDAKVSQIEITEELACRAHNLHGKMRVVAVTATFVPDLIQPSLDFWQEQLKIPWKVQFASYNQVIQQLLDPQGLLRTNSLGLNVVLIRPADWCPAGKEEIGSDCSPTALDRILDELIAALRTAAPRSSVPYLICLCPEGPNDSITTRKHTDGWADCFRRELSDVRNVHFVDGAELLARYPVATVFDPCADELGKIPYHRAFFAAIGTLIARKMHALHAAPRKVVVLDCDQTLWKGVCSEDGTDRIEIDAARQAFQEFMIAQRQSGMIISLVSKNDEYDVLEVFQRHPAMRLKLEHITARRINWNAKSENLKSLSRQLNLGLDSFIFIDDNPVECAEIQAECPEVLVLQFPQESQAILKFPHHVWSFDQARVTEEDKQRLEFYQHDHQREQLRSTALTLNDFVSSLDLKCEIGEMKPGQIGRVAQLTQRTNQFNTTTLRRSEAEILKFCSRAKHDCFVVTARDRFGDYGLVGAMFIDETSDAFGVESFLLSCRALGRGIEYQMLSYLGSHARSRGFKRIEFPAVPTPKNSPAIEFLKGFGSSSVGSRCCFHIPVEIAVSAKYTPSRDNTARSLVSLPTPAPPASYRLDSTTAMRIAAELCDIVGIERAIDHQQRLRQPRESNYCPPRTPIEDMLATLWEEILRINRPGANANFIELGGNSILGTVLISRIRKLFGIEPPLHVILENPTIAQLAEWIEMEAIDQMGEQDLDAAIRELAAISDGEAKRRLLKEETSCLNTRESQSP